MLPRRNGPMNSHFDMKKLIAFSIFWINSLVFLGGGPIAKESFTYNIYADGIFAKGASLGAASEEWSDDATLGGLELRRSNEGFGESLNGESLNNFDYTRGNRTLSEGPRRSIWNLQGESLALDQGSYYFSFLARTSGPNSSFRMELANEELVRWMPFKLNSDGSVETGLYNGHEVNEVSPSGAWEANKTFLIVARFRSGVPDFSNLSIFDLDNPEKNFLSEPLEHEDWLLSSPLNTGITLDRLIITASNRGVSIDELRIGTTYGDVVPGGHDRLFPATPKKENEQNRLDSVANLRPEISPIVDVLKPAAIVEQTLTKETLTRIHRIEESGDYQIGEAWIEVTGSQDASLEILKNGKDLIKRMPANAGTVTRFESRIEGLKEGDSLSIRIHPNGSNYRAGYKLALGTPTFDGLPVFDVHAPEFGAVGDGRADDFIAIRSAVDSAIRAGGGIVRFDGEKIYRAIGSRSLEIENLIELVGVSNIKIEGNGATVVLHPPDRLAFVGNCENVQVDGFIMTYDPIPYYQGIIDNIDLDQGTIDISVPERYEMPNVGSYPPNREKVFFAFAFMPDAPESRTGEGRHIHLVSSERIDRDPRKVRLHVKKKSYPSLRHAFKNGATEMVIPHPLYGHRGEFSIEVLYSSRVKFSNILCRMMPHLGIWPNNNLGPITFSNVDLLMENPETELFWSWRGAYSVTGHNRWGFLLEDGDWHGNAMYDDVLAFFMRRQDILHVNGQTLNLELGGFSHLFRPGDWISIWSEGQMELKGMSRVLSVGTKKEDGTFDLTLESLPEATSVNDVAINEELYNRNTLVKNCRNLPTGASDASTRIRTGGHFLDCHFEGLYLITEFDEIWHPVRARNLVLENCYFGRNSLGRMRLSGALNPRLINTRLDQITVYGNQGARDIFLDGVHWTNIPDYIVRLTDSSNAWVFGDSSLDGSAEGLNEFISVDDTSSVEFSAPSGN